MTHGTVFIGNYTDDEGDPNYIIFVARENCDRELELKRAYREMRKDGDYEDDDCELDTINIHEVYPIREAYDYNRKRAYKITLTPITKK